VIDEVTRQNILKNFKCIGKEEPYEKVEEDLVDKNNLEMNVNQMVLSSISSQLKKDKNIEEEN
jgi:hypothetical protein